MDEHEALAKIIEALIQWRNTHEKGGQCRNDYNEVLEKVHTIHSKIVHAAYPKEGTSPYLCRH
jgi:hypothetical protein